MENYHTNLNYFNTIIRNNKITKETNDDDFLCFFDLETTSIMKNDHIPKIRESTVIVLSKKQMASVSSNVKLIYTTLKENSSSVLSIIENIKNVISYANVIKSVKQQKHAEVFEYIIGNYPGVVFVAHNGFCFDYRILFNILPKSVNMICCDTLLAAYNLKKFKSLKNYELFKISQKDNWENYFLLNSVHTSLTDTIMMITWTQILEINIDDAKLDRCILEKYYENSIRCRKAVEFKKPDIRKMYKN